MSGQPVKTQSDVNKFRNEYLETLNLQEKINDANLQANKTYLLTGQLPPQSQLQDTRTNAEKLADIEKLKFEIANNLKSIAEPQVAYQIVSKVISSPLNLNNTLLRFLAQRASSLAEQIKKLMPYGIEGDENDIERVVEFIKNMYSEQQGKFQSTKSYLNSIGSQSTTSKVLSVNDIDSLILGLQDIIKNIDIVVQKGVNVGGIAGTGGIGRRIAITLANLKNALPTTDQIRLMMDDLENPAFIDPYQVPGQPPNVYPPPQLMRGVAGPVGLPGPILNYSRVDMEAFYKMIEKLPKYSETMALINKIKQHLNTGNYQLVRQGMENLENMFLGIEGINDAVLLNQFKNIKDRQSVKQAQANKLNAEQTREFIQGQSEEQKNISRAKKVYIVNPANDAVYVRDGNNPINVVVQGGQQALNAGAAGAANNGANAPAQPAQPAQQAQRAPPVQRQAGPLAAPAGMAAQARTVAIRRAVNALTPAELAQAIAYINGNYPNAGIVDANGLIVFLTGNDRYGLGDFGIGGLGLHKRRGRPRGSGMPKPVVEKIPNFVGFGINEINQKQLQKGIFKIRRGTRTNYPDMPSRRISLNLQNIIKTIVGGGVPKYEEFGRLDNEEKDYLYKIVSRSNLEDRLSVPAPSKDQQEKDIHNFEVMKGQIMSGNDSLELVKKFKLLTRKLSKQGLLPKADVDDILDTLTDLGY